MTGEGEPNQDERGKSYTWSAGLLSGIDLFEPAFFGISPREAAQMDPQQRLLLELVWHALEDAGIPSGKVAGSATGVYIGGATTDYRDPTPESPVLFKIHGDISRPETLVITDEDYIQFVLRMSNKDPYDPVPLTLKFFLTGWTTLFLGYSLLDYNLRLLFKTLRWKIDSANVPDMYSVDFRPDPLIFDVWHNQRRYVKFIAEDVWGFVPQLYERVLGKELPP